MRRFSRRQVLRLLSAAPALSITSWARPLNGLLQTGSARSVRKNAAQLTASEIALFVRGFRLLIRDKILDQFVAEHGNSTKHQQHELSPGVTTLLQSHLMPQPGGERFLAWHRAFLLEFEAAMRAAIGREDGETQAEKVFIPYWDFSHANNSIPAWVEDFKPDGIQAVAPAGLPPGHPGHGKEGHTYKVQVTRWPGTNPAVPYSPSAGLVSRVLRETDYTSFTRALEWAPGLVRPASDAEIDRTGKLISRLGRDAKEFIALVESLRAGAVDEQRQFPVLRALFHLESALAVPSVLPGADRGTMKQLLGTVTKFFQTGPHTDVHTWVAGHHALKPAVRGTAV
jgi:hypothetical protein